MPIFTIQAPDGRTVSLKGESAPTEKELEEIFATLEAPKEIDRPVVAAQEETIEIKGAPAAPMELPTKIPVEGGLTFKERAATLRSGQIPAAVLGERFKNELINELSAPVQFGAALGGPLISIPAQTTIEAGKEFIKTKDGRRAIEKGVSAGLIDATFFGVGRAFGAFGKKILGLSAKKGGALSDLAKETIDNNPGLLKPTRQRLDKIVDRGIAGIKTLKRTAGQKVSQLKNVAKQANISVDSTPLINEFNEELIERGLLKPGVKSVARDNIIKDVNKKILGGDALEIFSQRFKPQRNFEHALRVVDEIKSTKPYQRIFKKIAQGQQINSAEQLALDAVNKYSNSIFNSMDDQLLKAGITNARGEYSNVMSAIRDIGGRLDRDPVTKKLVSSLKQGNTEVFEAFRALDEGVAPQNKFFTEGIRNMVGNAASELSSFGLGEIARVGLLRGARPAAQVLQAGKGVPRQIAGAITRGKAREAFAEPFAKGIVSPVSSVFLNQQ